MLCRLKGSRLLCGGITVELCSHSINSSRTRWSSLLSFLRASHLETDTLSTFFQSKKPGFFKRLGGADKTKSKELSMGEKVSSTPARLRDELKRTRLISRFSFLLSHRSLDPT